MRRVLTLIGAVVLVALLSVPPSARAREGADAALPVCSACAYTTIEAALDAARPGDTIQVRGGTYRGPLVIAKPVSLVGRDRPVIDGGDHGTVVRITAPGVTLQGFVVRGSGASFDREDAGLSVEAARARILDNRFVDNLFGVYLRQAPDSVVSRNAIAGKPVAEPLRGDGIKVWYSHNAQIIGNRIDGARDCLIWFSDHSLIRDNTITHGRYGLHFMYSNGSVIEHNRLVDNSVGVYLMYGREMTVRDNLLQGNRGPSGQGLGLKEIDGADVENNLVVDNRIGLYVDNSPLSPGVFNHFRRNLFAYNDSGLALLPSDRNNVFSRNSLIDNLEQVTVLGGGTLGANQWAEGGAGNFWSDYAGYDANGDGVGDVPYRSEQLTEQLMDRAPALQLFRFSVAAVAVDAAARAFPVFRPTPKLVDPAPLTAPVLPVGAPLPAPPARTWPAPFLGLGGVMLVAFAWWGWWRGRGRGLAGRVTMMRHRENQVLGGAGVMIEARNLTKRYGDKRAIDQLSFSVAAGEAVALWGRNGAGKTTVLRCLLGTARYEGELTVAGVSPARQGTATRRLIGYVPQEMPTFDLTAGELTVLVARLRGVAPDQALARLGQFGLAPAQNQPVVTLSGGMKQKLALTLALLGDPPLLLLDEPTANLDAESQRELLTLLLALKSEGRTVLFTSHRWSEVRALADRVVCLDQGRQIDPPSAGLLEEHERDLLLRVALSAHLLDPAQALLREHGFTARRNGKALLVWVAAHQKAEPLVLLARSGYPVTDFALERGE